MKAYDHQNLSKIIFSWKLLSRSKTSFALLEAVSLACSWSSSLISCFRSVLCVKYLGQLYTTSPYLLFFLPFFHFICNVVLPPSFYDSYKHIISRSSSYPTPLLYFTNSIRISVSSLTRSVLIGLLVLHDTDTFESMLNGLEFFVKHFLGWVEIAAFPAANEITERLVFIVSRGESFLRTLSFWQVRFLCSGRLKLSKLTMSLESPWPSVCMRWKTPGFGSFPFASFTKLTFQ